MNLPKLQIDTVELREEWRSECVDPGLRTVVIVTMLMYYEQGAERCHLVRLLGDGARAYGRIADLSVLGLPGVSRAKLGDKRKRPTWIVKRVNVLFPSCDWKKETATYDGAVIRIEVPFSGYRKDCCALRDWIEWGPKPKELTPRVIRMVEP